MAVSIVVISPTEPTNFFGGMSGIIIFAPFLLDATFTLFRRAAARKNIFEAHRSHLYQLLARGVGAIKSLVLYVLLMLICSAIVLGRIDWQ
jgi:hypothetical protein